MLKNFLFNKTNMPLMEKTFDAYALRLKSISNNIANVNTKGYKSKEVHFEEKLQGILQNKSLDGNKTMDRHLEINPNNLNEVEAEVRELKTEHFNGRNNVSIDHEMLEMGKVQVQNAFLSKSMSGFFSSISSAIKGQSVR